MQNTVKLVLSSCSLILKDHGVSKFALDIEYQ